MARLEPQTFADRWRGRALTERASSQSHFNDLCDVLGVPKPTENRETDSSYGFEVRTELPGSTAFAKARRAGGDDAGQSHLFSIVTGVTGGSTGGFCDVWMEGHFCWEYKRPGKYKDLDAVFAQLNFYRNDLGNPPLLIACDIDTIEIRTNFTGFVPVKYVIRIDDLVAPGEAWRDAVPARSPIEVLRAVFHDPESLRPKKRVDEITEELAGEIGELAKHLREKGNDPQEVAHFLMQIVFCYFAEDAEFLPRDLLTRLFSSSIDDPSTFLPRIRDLFRTMATGGHFGLDKVEYFNGGLFVDGESVPDFQITAGWLGKLSLLGKKDWSNVEPSIFGTLFERSLDPDKRSQIGAHYTSRDDIMLVIEPVILRPLRAEWREVQVKVLKELERRSKSKTQAAKKKANQRIAKLIDGFHQRLWDCRVLDPACGSGNFLYVALQALMDLELEVRTFAARSEIQLEIRAHVEPRQLHGIEINTYACELARVSIWIGYLQWHRAHGDKLGRTPILEPLDTIENRDAILAWADEKGRPIPMWREGAACLGQAEWPEADYIVGNPPFLGAKLFRAYGLMDHYIESMYRAYELPKESDLCCYWFARSEALLVETEWETRVGLLATQGIRGGVNRTVLERLSEHADFFFAWSDRDWVLDGAAVHVSIIGFTNGEVSDRVLDGIIVETINTDMSSGTDVKLAETLDENENIYIRAPEKGGNFEIDHDVARRLLASPCSNGKRPIEVLSRWTNANGLSKKRQSLWIIDFPNDSTLAQASGYDPVFRVVESQAKTTKAKGRTLTIRDSWWTFRRSGQGVRDAQQERPRILTSPMTSKFRLFIWLDPSIQPDKGVPCFARSDDYFFGVLHSSIHELWARRQGTQLREYESGFRYTPTTCFETFPMPWAPGKEPGDKHAIHAEISAAAKDLNAQRERWLNPPEWLGPIAEKIDRFDKFDDVAQVSGEEARRLIRESAIDAAAAAHSKLKKRTLTNLYNERPAWLAIAHERLDRAVIAAYRETDPDGGWEPDWAAVWKETGAGQPIPEDDDDGDQKRAVRTEIEQNVLANLLRLNQERA